MVLYDVLIGLHVSPDVCNIYALCRFLYDAMCCIDLLVCRHSTPNATTGGHDASDTQQHVAFATTLADVTDADLSLVRLKDEVAACQHLSLKY